MSADEAVRKYPTPFQRHLSFFDRNNDGMIYFGESLRGNLAIGLDFPVAVALACGYHAVYANSGPIFLGPFRGIEIAKVQASRNMLEQIPLEAVPEQGLERKEVITLARANGLMDRSHVNGLWAFSANGKGYLSKNDIRMYQQGTMLYELEQRRKGNRDHVLPLYRGGPISVAGHSYFVEKMFGVKVYQKSEDKKSG